MFSLPTTIRSSVFRAMDVCAIGRKKIGQKPLFALGYVFFFLAPALFVKFSRLRYNVLVERLLKNGPTDSGELIGE